MASYQSQSSTNGRSYESWSYDSLKNFGQISPRVQNHLKLVYLTLCCALGASAVGAYLHVLMNIGGFLTFLGVIGGIVWLMATPPHDERKRFGILMGTALLEGATVGPLIERVIEFDPRFMEKGLMKDYEVLLLLMVLSMPGMIWLVEQDFNFLLLNKCSLQLCK